MSQPRDPGRNKGKDSRVKNKSQRNNARKSAPVKSRQDREMRNKVRKIYLIVVSVCGVLIIVFSLLVANKLKKAGVIFEPEETNQMLASIPIGEDDETETSATTEPTESIETIPVETIETTTYIPGATTASTWNYNVSVNNNVTGTTAAVIITNPSSETTTVTVPDDTDITVETEPATGSGETETTEPTAETPSDTVPPAVPPVEEPPAGDTDDAGDVVEGP